jgi:hypothetical protein
VWESCPHGHWKTERLFTIVTVRDAMQEIEPQVIDWLPEDENPSVQYRTLTELGMDREDDRVSMAAERCLALDPPDF